MFGSTRIQLMIEDLSGKNLFFVSRINPHISSHFFPFLRLTYSFIIIFVSLMKGKEMHIVPITSSTLFFSKFIIELLLLVEEFLLLLIYFLWTGRNSCYYNCNLCPWKNRSVIWGAKINSFSLPDPHLFFYRFIFCGSGEGITFIIFYSSTSKL